MIKTGDELESVVRQIINGNKLFGKKVPLIQQ